MNILKKIILKKVMNNLKIKLKKISIEKKIDYQLLLDTYISPEYH